MKVYLPYSRFKLLSLQISKLAKSNVENIKVAHLSSEIGAGFKIKKKLPATDYISCS